MSSDDPFRIYIKTLEERLARQHALIQAWPRRIAEFQWQYGRLEAQNYTLYMENEDLKKEIAALKKTTPKRKRWKPKVIHGPWRKT